MISRNDIERAIGWSAIDVLFRYGVRFIVLIILARILQPEDFGLVAMLALFIGLGELLIDSGFSHALIQRQDTTHVDESTIFFFTLFMSVVVALALISIAPAIAEFFDQTVLRTMTYWMALNLFLTSFGSIHTTLLTKKLDFKTVMKAGSVAALISGIAAVVMAMRGLGVWSLVGQVLISTLVNMILLWILCSWRPLWTFSLASLRSLFGFGGYLLLTGFLGTLYKNLYALLIGKLHTVQDVGFYSQAQRLQQLPVNILTNVIARVAFPVFSATAKDKVLLAQRMSKALMSVMFINIPIMLALLVLAEPLVVGLLGSKWSPSVPVLQALALVGLMWPLQALNTNVLKAQGHSNLNAKIQVVKLTIGILILVLTSPYGIVAIAYGQVVASFLIVFVNGKYTKKFLNYGVAAQIRDIIPILVASIPMVIVIKALFLLNVLPLFVSLPIAVLAGGGVYLLACKGLGIALLDELLRTLRSKRENAA